MKMLMVICMGVLCCITVGYTACKKDNPLVINSDTGIVFLRDASLSQVRFTMKGSWKIHYMYGGFTGHQKTDLLNTDLYFLSNDSIYISVAGQQNAADKVKFVRKQTEFGYTAWCMKFKYINDIPEEWIVDYLFKDTLTLVQNNPDPYGYFMTKYP